MSCLYMIATPIGNLDDITLRAIKTLQQADVIACEDTRHTQIMLTKLQITGKRLISCHAHNESQSALGIVKLLEQNFDVAYCSDAGTPGISDPGSRIVEAVREAGFDAVPIPGASACVTLISVAGLAGKTFTFEGFLSPKSGRRKKRLQTLLSREEAFVIYESPFRIEKTIEEIGEIAPERRIIVGREMTKMFEQFVCGTASEIKDKLKTVKGEFALCVFPPDNKNSAGSEDPAED